MADIDAKKLQKLISDSFRSLKDIVEVIKHKVDTQQMFQSNAAENIRLMKEQQSIMNEKLDRHTENFGEINETLEDHTKRLEALSGDVEQLHQDVKGIRDQIGLSHSRNKREIDEIKTHLGLPLMPDVSEL